MNYLEEYKEYYKDKESPVEAMKYRDNIIKLLDNQTHKGLMKYGLTLDESRLTVVDTLTYLEEELIDAIVYIQHVKEWLANGTKEEAVKEQVSTEGHAEAEL